jgi:hypothetical protein
MELTDAFKPKMLYLIFEWPEKRGVKPGKDPERRT